MLIAVPVGHCSTFVEPSSLWLGSSDSWAILFLRSMRSFVANDSPTDSTGSPQDQDSTINRNARLACM